MEILIVICITLVTIITIVGVLGTIEKCSYYKWRAHNPEAFRYEFERMMDDMEDDR